MHRIDGRGGGNNLLVQSCTLGLSIRIYNKVHMQLMVQVVKLAATVDPLAFPSCSARALACLSAWFSTCLNLFQS